MGRNSRANWLMHMADNNGFTLIEVLVTALILTVGLLGTLGLTTGVIRGNFFSKNITSATAIAESQLEAVQNRGYVNATTTYFPAAAATVTVGAVNFSRTTTITSDSPSTNMKTVSVTVTWTEANNAARSVSLQTILAQ
jgi:type IV pilus assembly protein PilV